jgi:hypothetical protein
LVAKRYVRHKQEFPVLPGYGFVSNLPDSSFGFPQLWIVDAKAQWQWTEVGFGSNDWEENVISKLEVAKAAKRKTAWNPATANDVKNHAANGVVRASPKRLASFVTS